MFASTTKYKRLLINNNHNAFVKSAVSYFTVLNRNNDRRRETLSKETTARPFDSGFNRRASSCSYVQGQSPESQPRIREYFYYIDHQGMLFLDDSRIKNFTSCLKDKKFLSFFFKRLRKNETDRYARDFPYLSLCGRERNYVRCDDLPIVFTHVIKTDRKINANDELDGDNETTAFVNSLSYAHADDLLTVPFQPERISMDNKTGRVYHPAPETVGGVGLVRSKLAIEFSKQFEFVNGEDQNPTHFTWDGNRYELDTVWYKTTTGR